MLVNILLIAITGTIVYIFFIKPNQNERNKEKKLNKSNDIKNLLDYKTIHKDGLMEFDNHTYKRMVQIFPTNITLKSSNEEINIWEEFRNVINSISIPWRLIIQTKILQIQDHIEEIEETATIKNLANSNPALNSYLKETVNNLKQEYQDSGRRDSGFYILFEINPNEFLDNENSLAIDSELGSALSSYLPKKQENDIEEIENLAINELENAINLLMAGLNRIEIQTKILDKVGVLDYINTTLNKDLSVIQSIEQMQKMGVMNSLPKSLTVDYFLSKQALIELEQRENIFTSDFEYAE